MLEPRDNTNIPALFIIFVVLPLVTYFLLGKWSEVSKRKEQITLIAKREAEETFRGENMAVGSVFLIPSLPNDGIRQCARCFIQATTRCSKCKSVWYCSGRCQIIHWRQVHKLECEQLGNNYQSSSPKTILREEYNVKYPKISPNESNLVFSQHRAEISCAFHENDTVERQSMNESDSAYSDKILMERNSTKWVNKSRTSSNSRGVKPQKSPRSGVKVSKESSSSHANIKGQTDEDSARKPKKVNMLFPYEEFVKCFEFEVLNVSPRGLVNCGNSCYANAVLQCLTCTKPLSIYLLRQSHSRAGCTKDWCLMCELEHHVLMLRESGSPLSPGNILVHIRSLNSQIGDGSQEDAHEFLRLIVASMQSICLEGLGGENVVDPKLQDTTFIQHTFGGRLRSKVKCLRCHHESERYENIMDLTLEIFGWVESLEDALTQFTSSEDLDGENMYRCGRCASYVRARKQLRIQEAPNILTIVLKRFQEGNYGKINKCITFPEILDMVPFMTGTDDIPPLYMLYSVVVHLDTSNASFSGHYISYVKDLQGNWFKVDDTEVEPVDMSQVMSEGAYILFYMRSYPRPARGYSRKATCHQTPDLPKHNQSKIEKSTRPQQSKPNSNWLETNVRYTDISRDTLMRENRSRPQISNNYSKFSDATSSDWSLFTSSDDASFTTDSTRDSFSTVDYAESLPFSSIFQSLYPGESTSRRTISCSVFPNSHPQTIFAQEETGLVFEGSYSDNCDGVYFSNF